VILTFWKNFKEQTGKSVVKVAKNQSQRSYLQKKTMEKLES
jgi:hypothetical protein